MDPSHAQARTAVDGSYEMTVHSDESYVVTVADDEWAAPSRIGIVVREGRPAEGIDLRLVRGTLIQGAATIGSDRRPAEGSYVTLAQSGGSIPDELKGGDSYYHEVRMDRNATTDASGRYRFRVGPGTYSLQIQGQTMPETIKVEQEAELIRDFGMARPKRGPISGRVVLAEDPTRGVARAKIYGVVQSLSRHRVSMSRPMPRGDSVPIAN